jgi:transposase
MGQEKSDTGDCGAGKAADDIGGIGGQRKGAFWFATYQGGPNAELFVGVLEFLMRHRRRPLFLVLDNLATHKAKVVVEYVAGTNGKLEPHYLPGYAPELNPDELVWNYMKRTATARGPLGRGDVLQDNIEANKLAIQRNRGLVRSFLRAPYVAFITD